jgi:hypothetical protein
VCRAQFTGDGSYLCDILCELAEPHGVKGAAVCGKPASGATMCEKS